MAQTVPVELRLVTPDVLNSNDVERLFESLHDLHRKVNQIMADITALNDAVSALDTDEVAAAGELQALAGQVAQLSTSQAPSQEQIDGITQHLTSIASSLKTATTGAETPPVATPPAPTPGPEGTPAPSPGPEGTPAPAPGTPPAV